MDFCVFVLLLVLNKHTGRELRKSAQGLGVHYGPESFLKGNRKQWGVNTTADMGIRNKSSF